MNTKLRAEQAAFDALYEHSIDARELLRDIASARNTIAEIIDDFEHPLKDDLRDVERTLTAAGYALAAIPAPDEVLVALERIEEYEDVDDELLAEDAIGDRWPYRVIRQTTGEQK